MLIFSCWVFASTAILADGEIDGLLANAYQQNQVSAAPICSDDAFLRRVSLDLIGRVPTREELHQFRIENDRRAKIDELLASDEFNRFWSELWTTSLVGYEDRRSTISREPLRMWIETALRDRMPYDQLVRQLIAAEGSSAFDGPVNFLLRHRQEPAVKVSRMFLGVRLDCARCHDHPFARWTQEDFERFKAFFRTAQFRPVSQRNTRLTEVPRQATDQNRPRFLTGAQPRTSRWRDELALFVTTCRPFARNFGNRIWYQLMGRGIVDPPDDFVEEAAVLPELLERLADHATESEFDVRSMIRVIANSQAYQRESGYADATEVSHRLFASYVPKPLTPHQLMRSLEIVTDTDWSDRERTLRLARLTPNGSETDFSETWSYRDNVQDVMQNLVEEIRVDDSNLTAIFERILSRAPDDEELQRCGKRPKSQVVFALIHSNEFRFSH